MARRTRDYTVVNSAVFVTSAATSDALLDIYAPTEGALIVDAVFTVNTAAVGTGTVVIVLEEANSTIALTTATASLNFDQAIHLVVGTGVGNGTGATSAGTRLQAQIVHSGTTTTTGNWGVTVTWLL